MSEFELRVKCGLCGEDVDPVDKKTFRRVQGWEQIAGIRLSGKQGGSDISLRERLDEWAHPACIALAKSGVHREQGELFE